MIDIFKWNESFNTDIKFMDEQHKGLVKELNNAIKLCLSDKKIDKKDIDDFGSKLTDYINTHLSAEEKLMDEVKLDERYVKIHKAEHNEFKEKCANFFDSVPIDVDKAKVQRFLEFLISWLAYHILSTDKSLGRQVDLIKKGINAEKAYAISKDFVDKNADLLLKALRALFSIVDEKNVELAKANKNLELKVQSRTSELEKVNKQLEIISMNDELTGLPNRRYALETLEQCIKTWKRYGTFFSLVFVDADKFKSVNDTFGHEYGDIVLNWIAHFLCTNFRESDIVCRLGGDEFLVICTESDADSSYNAVNSLIEKARATRKSTPLKYWDISFSIGVAGVSKETDTASGLLKTADEAMYVVKKNGGNGVSKG
jgi:hemerythrin